MRTQSEISSYMLRLLSSMHTKLIKIPRVKRERFIKVGFGYTRLTLSIGPLCFKFARSALRSAFQTFFDDMKSESLKFAIHEFSSSLKSDSDEYISTYKHFLMKGIGANIREYQLWKNSSCDILVPTLFSLNGLLNIQYDGARLQRTNYISVWKHIWKATKGDNQIYKDAHTLREDHNFVIQNNLLKLADYASSGIAPLINKYSISLTKEFKRATPIYQTLNKPDLSDEKFWCIQKLLESCDYTERDNLYQSIIES